jgi:hypothetical protein
VWDPTKATLANLLATWSGHPATDWEDWFQNGLTSAWFQAAAYNPKDFTVLMFPLADIDAWKMEAAGPSATDRLRHFISATDQFRHCYFRDNLFARHASQGYV